MFAVKKGEIKRNVVGDFKKIVKIAQKVAVVGWPHTSESSSTILACTKMTTNTYKINAAVFK